MSLSKKRVPISLIARECGIEPRLIFHFIHEEWIVPPNPEYLDEQDIARAILIRELQTVFGVNDEGISLILHLLDQLYGQRYGEREAIRKVIGNPGEEAA